MNALHNIIINQPHKTKNKMIYFVKRNYRVTYYNEKGELKVEKIQGVSRRSAYNLFKMVYPEYDPIKVVLY